MIGYYFDKECTAPIPKNTQGKNEIDFGRLRAGFGLTRDIYIRNESVGDIEEFIVEVSGVLNRRGEKPVGVEVTARPDREADVVNPREVVHYSLAVAASDVARAGRVFAEVVVRGLLTEE